ncbi:glucose 1-dehydrogenase [Mesorhizobium robiniae]|uniref:Glucose 1-dehydrogenase n=1 Tax=Mesorhizobium robiniae TaxID=559315 RepID=A0ABV2GGA4_9HYPH
MTRYAIVTGAGGGIGGASARAVAAAGCHVGLFDIDEDAAMRTLRNIEAAGGSGEAYEVDCGDTAGLRGAVARFMADAGPPDVVVSAVALERHGGLFATSEADIHASFQTTVVGAYALLAATTAHMQQTGGQIVVISSPHAIRPFAGALAYNIAEAGLRQLALTAAHELARFRIAVNLVEPGWTDTPGERLLYTEEFLAESASKLPWGRRAAAEEIGAAVAYLTSEAARYISGATLRVDGAMGVSMARLPGLEPS